MKYVFKLLESLNKSQAEYLYYDDLEITLYGKLISGTYYQPPEYEEHQEVVDYDYRTTVDEVVSALCLIVSEQEEHTESMSDKELQQYVEDNYDDLLDKYYQLVLNDFRDDAEEQAQRYYQKQYRD